MNRSKLNRIWAKESELVRRDPGDEKYDKGWIAEIPTYQVLNYLQWKIDTTLLAVAERGIAEWGTDVEYQLGSVVWDNTDKTIYIATVGKPDRNKKPSANKDHWTQSAIQVSRLEFDKVNTAINNHIADLKSNPHKVTANGIGAYTKEEINSIVNTYNALVASHSNDKNNPHGTKAVDIGAVPVTGGKYTGEVIFDKSILFDDDGKVKLRVDTYSDGKEVYLVNGDWLLGMYRNGKPVTGKPGNMSEIITEKTFADYKAKFQGSYAVPTPVFYMPLINDINIVYGTGDTEFKDSGASYPVFIEGGFSLSDDIKRDLILSDNLLRDNINWTISLQVKFNKPLSGDASNVLRLYIGGPSLFWFKRNGVIEFWGVSGSGSPARANVPKDTNWHTYTFTARGTSLVIAIDGKVVDSRFNTKLIIMPNTPMAITNELKSGSETNVNRVRNLKMWNHSLSDEQISMV